MHCLDASPEAECVVGNLFPPPLAHLAAQPLPPEIGAVLQTSLRTALRDYVESGAYHSRAAAVRKWWNAERSLGEVRGAIEGARRERTVIYKEPFFSFAPQFVFDTLPESVLVYIYRDGRDVANSLVRSYGVLTDAQLASLESNEAPLGRRHGPIYFPWWVEPADEEVFVGASPYVRAIMMWREMVRRWKSFAGSPQVENSNRIHLVRYEDLMSGDKSGPAMVEKLGLEMTPRMAARFAEAHGRSVGSHSRVSASDLALAEELAGAELDSLGYATA
jgi:hypothetical protein